MSEQFQHEVVGLDMAKHHCNACGQNFYVDADVDDDVPYYCPFCGSDGSIYATASWWVRVPVDKTRMNDDLLVKMPQ